MSGFEVAGIVLGAIPFVISALENYEKTKGATMRWRCYQSEIHSLIEFLQEQEIKIQEFCMVLLDSLGFYSQIDTLLKDLSETAWGSEDNQSMIKSRIWVSYELFERGMRDMNKAIDEMKMRLGLQNDGKIPWLEGSFMTRESKRIKFSLRRSKYDDLKTKVRDAISRIEGAINRYLRTKYYGELQFKGRLADSARELSKSVYHALESSFRCQCTHNLHLGLNLPATATARTTDKDLLDHLEFKLVLTYSVPGETAETAHVSNETTTRQVLVRTLRKTEVSLENTAGPTTSDENRQSEARILGKSSDEKFATTSLVQNTLTSIKSTPGPSRLFEATNLCDRLRESQRPSTSDCYGVIWDPSKQFNRRFSVIPASFLSHDANDNGSWGVVSLNEILERPRDFPYISFSTKLRLATIVSHSFLQLRQTPWLPTTFTSRELFFSRTGSEVEYRNAFVKAHLPERMKKRQQSSGAVPKELWSLGLLLLELNLGKTLDSLRHQYEEPDDELALPDEAIIDRELFRQENWNGSYGDVVKLCLWGENGEEFDLNDEESRQQIYHRVVARLEDDLEKISLHRKGHRMGG